MVANPLTSMRQSLLVVMRQRFRKRAFQIALHIPENELFGLVLNCSR
jgi:hypothetical protein